MKEIIMEPIGIIYTPFTEIKGTPIQPIASQGTKGKIVIDDKYLEGLLDIDGFSHITLVYYFHRIQSYSLQVIPFMDDKEHGIFSTKAPKRPNKIGISTVKLISCIGNCIEIEDVDMLNETPLLDIKPFYPRYDNRENVKIGWLEKNKNISIESMKADQRFE